jgi:ubiquitin-like protein ATG12
VRLQPIGSAPHLNTRVFKLSTNQRFETIVRFLRRKLGLKAGESVFCYVGSVFAPGLDEGVGGLWTVSLCLLGVMLGRGDGMMGNGVYLGEMR